MIFKFLYFFRVEVNRTNTKRDFHSKHSKPINNLHGIKTEMKIKLVRDVFVDNERKKDLTYCIALAATGLRRNYESRQCLATQLGWK